MKRLTIIVFMVLVLVFSLAACDLDGDPTKPSETSPPHEHHYIVVKTIDPTCTQNGSVVYKCEHCDDSYSQEMPAKGHSYIDTVVEPTCTEQGYTTHTCSVCNDSYEDSYVDVIEHNWGDWVVIREATAQSDGLAERTCVTCHQSEEKSLKYEEQQCNHNYIAVITAPTCTEQGYTTYTCSKCNDFYIDDYKSSSGHTEVVDKYKAPGCESDGLTEGKHCSTCGTILLAQEVIAPTGHVWSDWVVIKAPTTTETGTAQRVCEECDKKETVTLDKVVDDHVHEYKSEITKNATCTEDGVKTFMCSCGDNYTESIAATGHDYDKIKTNPTCTEKGYTTYTCKNDGCHYNYKADYTDAKGHSYDNGKVTSEPSCTKEGVKTFTCKTCGDKYTESVAKTEHSWQDATCIKPKTCKDCGATNGSANGHTWQDATCTSPKTCSKCQETTGSALGHSWQSATCTAPKTCTRCNATEGSANGHNWAAATCTAPKTCKTCGATSGSANGHSWKDATCTSPKTCSVCGKTDGNANGHSYGNWYVEKNATCTANGSERRDCKNCSHYESRDIAATGHDWDVATCTEPKTCKTCGATSGASNGHTWSSATCTAPKTCTVCGATSGSALGHSWKAATCTSPKTCTRCNVTDGSALGHNYTKVVTAPTCTAQGYTTYTCSGCNDSYNGDYTNTIDHDYTSQVTKSPTCTESGVRTYTCTMCGNKYTETISATGHQNTKSETVDGYVVVTCVDCGAEVSKTPVSSGGTCVLCGSARVTKNLAEAVAADIAAGYHDFQRYANFFDWNVQVCGSCGWIEESTIELAYSDYEACEIMLGYVNELRREVYQNESYFDMEIDQTLLELAKIRAKEICVNFVHYGGTPTCACENITGRGPNIIDHFNNWLASEGHYKNMIDGTSKFFGYALYKPLNGTVVYGVQLFWSYGQKGMYEDDFT